MSKQHPADCLCEKCVKAKAQAIRDAQPKPEPQSSAAYIIHPSAWTDFPKIGFDLTSLFQSHPHQTATKKGNLASAVASQIAEMTADLDFRGHDELPGPKNEDKDRYDVAWSSAVKNCQHEQIVDTLYGREWQCQQCGRYFDRTTLPKRGLFGW